jgi:hypothetical protein
MSWKHTNKFPGADGVWPEHINRCKQIFTVLDIAYEWGGQREILVNNITMASNLIVGIKFKSPGGNSRVVYVLPAFQQVLQSRIDKAGEELRKFDPSYVTPKPKRKKAGLF